MTLTADKFPLTGQNLSVLENGHLLLANGANDILDQSAGSFSTQISRLLLFHMDQLSLLHEKPTHRGNEGLSGRVRNGRKRQSALNSFSSQGQQYQLAGCSNYANWQHGVEHLDSCTNLVLPEFIYLVRLSVFVYIFSRAKLVPV